MAELITTVRPPTDLVTQLTDSGIEALWESALGRRLNATDLGRAFGALLERMGVKASLREIEEALPPAPHTVDLTSLRNGLLAFGYQTDECRWHQALGVPPVPSVWLPAGRAAVLLLDGGDKKLIAYDTETGTETSVDAKRVRGTLLSISSAGAASTADESLITHNLLQVRGQLWLAFALSLVSNVIALAMPMFVMVVYDQIIGSGATDTLQMLIVGMAGALCLDLLTRRLRMATLADLSERLGYQLGAEAVGKILKLPSRMTERAPLSSQVARVKDIERLRGGFSASVLQSLMDLPFVLLFAGVIYVMAGPLVLVPLVTIALLMGGGALYAWVASVRTRRAGRASAAREALLLEVIEHMRSLRVGSATTQWRERFEQLNAETTKQSYRSNMLNTVASTLTQSVGQFAGLATIVAGVYAVLAGDLTTGGLIASMILVWRVLGPVQSLVLNFSRLQQAHSASRQFEGLMRMSGEASESPLVADASQVQGTVEFDRVTFRYGYGDPEIMNLSFKANPGDVVAVIGPNGSGKSTVLKLIAGLYYAQSGAVRIDGHDIRQFDPRKLRQTIAYVPQKAELMRASVAENLRLARPTATDEELWLALNRAGAAESVEALPEGLQTAWDPRHPQLFPNGLLIRLSLARAYLRAAPITVLDEPIGGLDFEGEFRFMEALADLRLTSTVFLVTHRPGHLKVANKVALLHGGTLRYFGDVDEVHDKLTRELM